MELIYKIRYFFTTKFPIFLNNILHNLKMFVLNTEMFLMDIQEAVLGRIRQCQIRKLKQKIAHKTRFYYDKKAATFYIKKLQVEIDNLKKNN